MLVVGLVLFFAQVGSPILPNPEPVTVRTESHITVQAPPPDPQVVADTSVQSFQAIIVNLIAPTLAEWASDALDNPADFFRRTPPEWTYDNPGVKALADVIRNNAFRLLTLILIVYGLSVLVGRGSSPSRPLWGFVLCVGNMVLWQIGIRLNNALCDEIAAPPLRDIVGPHMTLPALTQNPTDAFGTTVLVIVYAGVVILLTFSMLGRLALINALIVVGSIALLLKGTDQSESFATRYQHISVGVLFSQVPIVICLKLAPILGGIGTGIVGTAIAIGLLLLARKFPAMLMRTSDGGGGGIGQRLLVRGVLRRVGMPI